MQGFGRRLIRVFLVDDHEIVRRGLHELLDTKDDIWVVGECSSVAEAVRRIPTARPDVMVLDARLEDGNGVEVCREVRSIDPSIQGLILTSYDDEDALVCAVVAGAAGYVLKQIHGVELLDAIRRVATGRSLIDPALAQRVRDWVVTAGEQSEVARLGDQQRAVLAGVAEGLTNRQIADRTALGEQTVREQVAVLVRRLIAELHTRGGSPFAGG
jgi:two-component system response regulator DevR